MIVMGVRDPGALKWKGSASSENTMIDHSVVTADLKAGDVIELAISNIRNGSIGPRSSLLVRAVTVTRSDLPR